MNKIIKNFKIKNTYTNYYHFFDIIKYVQIR